MALVTDSEVKAIIDTTRDTTPFITIADLIITEQLSDKGLSDDRLKTIELYLAAHYTAITEERGALKSIKIGEATDTFDSQAGQGLKLTRYGQQAISFDTSGTLIAMSSRTFPAQFRVI